MNKRFSRSERFWGTILYGVFWLLGQFPAWWHYFWADLLGWLLRSLFRYRRVVVREHLLTSFPEKDDAERRKLECRIYQHLANLIVEYIMLAGFSKQQLKKHIQCDAASLMERLHQKQGKRNVFYLLGHYGNWEWFTGFQAMLPMTQFYVIYKHQKGFVNYLLYLLRSKFGAQLIEKKMSAREIISLRKSDDPKTFIFVADQSPNFASIHLYVNFLNRETAVFTGMERLARSMQVPVVYIDVWQKRRGRYFATGELLTEDASTLEEGVLSSLFMRKLEQSILRQPELWLWTHRRWKHSKEEIIAYFPDKKIMTR